MFSGKNKKNSIFSLALVAVLASALFLLSGGLVPAAADTDFVSLGKYVTNGISAYEYDTDGMTSDASAEMTAVVDAATAYASAVTADDGSIEASFARLYAYEALGLATAAYNTAYPDSGYQVSVVDDAYTPATTYAAALASVKAAANGWEAAFEGDYEVSYKITVGGEAIINVYAMGVNGSYLVEAAAEGVTGVVKGSSKNEVQSFTFNYEGNEYSLEVAFSKTTHQDEVDLTVAVVYGNLKIVSAKQITADGKVDVTLFTAEGLVQQSKISTLITTAEKYFNNVPAQDGSDAVKAKYNEIGAALYVKIDSIKQTAAKTLISNFNKELYKASVYAEIEAAIAAVVDSGYETVKGYLSATAEEDTIVAYVEGLGHVSYPAQFIASYGNLVVENLVYEGVNKDNAYAAIRNLDGLDESEFVNLSAVQAELASAKAIIFNNLKATAKSEITARAEDAIGSAADYSPEQIRAITKKYVEVKATIDAATSVTELRNAVDGFDLMLDSFQTDTSATITNGNVTVEIVGAKFSVGTVLEAETGVVAEESDDIIQGKKRAIETRRLNAVESFAIGVKDGNGNYIDYATAGVTYKVTVKLNEETINLLESDGIVLGSIKILYIDGAGRPEVLEVEYTEGSIMFDTTHFSTYYLMGNTSNLALTKLTNLLSSVFSLETLMPVLIALGVIAGVLLLFVAVCFIVSVCTRYVIKFVPNGGTKVKKLRRRYGKKLPELAVPEREGYVFTGWCIDKTLKYEFNRLVMPRSNVKLYARWMTEEEYNEQQTDAKKLILVGYYDKLRAKLASCKKPVKTGEKSFIKQDILAKLYAEENQIKIFVKTKLNCIKDENGTAYIVADADKYEEGIVTDEISYNNAVEAINKMAEANGLVMGEEPTLTASTYNDAVLGYAYIINYDNIADFDERYCALRAYALAFSITDAEKAEAGKVLFELLPNGKETLDLSLALDLAKYGKILGEKTTVGDLKNVYTITDGECMGVALELIERVMNENGFTAGEAALAVEAAFNPAEAYQYIIEGAEEPVEEVVEEVVEETVEEVVEEVVEEEAIEEVIEEVVEEIDLAEIFKQYRAYVCSFAMFSTDGVEIDRANDGRVIVRAKLGAEAVETTLDPECDAEAFLISNAAELEAAKEKVAAVMAKYGFEYGEPAEVADVELAEGEMFGYRIKFPPVKSVAELLGELRDYTNSFAMFAEEGVEPDTTLDGTVVVTAVVKEGVIAVTVDPNAEAQELTVANEAELEAAKEAVAAVMAKYGLEVDPDYVAATERVEGEGFGFRIKF